MNNVLVDAAVNRTRTTLLLLFAVVLAGSVARCAIPIEAEPRVEVPFFAITVIHEGISPEDSARLLVKPLEIELRTVEGVEEVTAFASEGAATVMVEFDADYDLDTALLDTREAVDRAKPELPTTAEEPIISEQNTDSFPIIQINLVGDDVPERMLFDHARVIQDSVETLPNILEARLQGDREEVLEIVVDPAQLEAYGMTNEQLINTVIRNNRLIPAGSLDTGQGRMAVKVPSVIEQADDLLDLPVLSNGDSVVTLSDVATVRRTFKDRTSHARVNGQRTISMDVIKRSNANIIDTIDALKALVAEHEPNLPNRVTLFYTQDASPRALQQVTELEGNIVTALALVMTLVVAAMGLRSGLIVGVGIPISFLFALIFIYLFDYTFNFMVMFGMLLGLGMLIDGAIVVTEYADRKMVEGFDNRAAYTLAAKRMFWPVTASVATTLAAFLPLMFWPGVAGKFMRYLPVTVFTVLSGSLLYALVFCPTIGSRFGRPSARDARQRNTLTQLENGDPTTLGGVTGWYARLLMLASHHSLVTMGIIASILAATFWAYGNYGGGMTFFTGVDPMQGRVSIRARGNLSANEIDAIVREVEGRILPIPGIKDANTFTSLPGGTGEMFMGGASAKDIVGTVMIELHDQMDRSLTGVEILEMVRRRTADLAGIRVEVQKEEMGPPVGKSLQIQFSALHKEEIQPVIGRVRDFMDTQVTGLRDVDDTRSLPGVEWSLSVDRAQAALYGADVSLVGLAVQLVTAGVKIAEYRPDNADDALDIRIRYPNDARGVAALDELKIATPKGQVPISNFVRRTPLPNVDTIQRIDGDVVEFIRAEVAPGVLADDKVREIGAWIERQDFDPRVTVEFRGANEEQARSIAFVSVAFVLSLILMFMLLVTQFNSFYQSTLILVAVVMSTAGVLLGLLVTQMPFSAIMTGVGVVALAGIVVNNNIVLIDTYNHLRREHPDIHYLELIARTGAQRLRPVLLTTVTTVFGLLPLATNFSIDFINREIVYGSQVSGFWIQTSQAIVSGLTFATLLTLIATPAMLAVPEQLKSGVRQVRARFAGSEPAPTM